MIFGDARDVPSRRLTPKQAQAYANTPLEFFARKSLPFTFYGVTNPGPMLQALKKAGTC